MSFDAAHTPAQGNPGCPARLHGHTYTLEVVLAADVLQDPGFVVDFGVLGGVLQRVDECLDHRNLNEVDVLTQPTDQGITEFVRDLFARHLPLRDGVELDQVAVWSPLPATADRLGADEVTFEAAHQLPGLPGWHKCGRLHGHSYTATVVFSDPDADASALLGPFFKYAAEELDGSSLNESVGGEPPTSEYLARHLFTWTSAHLDLPDGVQVNSARVSETRSTWAEYLPDSL